MRKISRKSFKKNLELFVLTLPAIIAYLIFAYLPMFGVVIAFKKYRAPKGILGSAWNGFENFKFFFLRHKMHGELQEIQ